MSGSPGTHTVNRDQWLIRTAQNVLAGPYTREQVQKLVHEGRLTVQDEVCPANGYWIFLHEREEVIQQLGIEPPRAASTEDEVTETQTQTQTGAGAPSGRAGRTPESAPEVPDLNFEDFSEEDLGQTSMIARDSLLRTPGDPEGTGARSASRAAKPAAAHPAVASAQPSSSARSPLSASPPKNGSLARVTSAEASGSDGPGSSPAGPLIRRFGWLLVIGLVFAAVVAVRFVRVKAE